MSSVVERLRGPLPPLILGLMVGFAVGFIIGERQPIRPARALEGATPGTGAAAAIPEGHPPIPSSAGGARAPQQLLERQVAEVKAMLEERPDDHRLMVALGNIYYDAGSWSEARVWYRRALEREPDMADVMVDLAVVLKNLDEAGEALALLDRVIELEPDHWQAWHNKVVILHFDLHRSREAQQALQRLQAIAAANPAVPDLSQLEKEVLGG